MLGTTNSSGIQASMNNLSISINGTNKLTYNGKNNASLDITLSSLGGASSSHNHDSIYSKLNHTHSYLPLSGGTITGSLYTSNQPVYVTGNNTGIESGGNDTAALDRKNNLNINSWYGVSFSSDCSGAWTKLPTVTINCRNGDIRSRGIVYCERIVGNGTTMSNNLNADLLDGNHASAFSLTSHNHDSKYFRKAMGGIDADYNTILTDGRYSGPSNKRPNSPSPTELMYGDLDVRVSGGGTHNNSNNWIWQTLYRTERTILYFRGRTNSSPWQPWVVLAYPNSGPTCMQSSSPGDTRLMWAW